MVSRKTGLAGTASSSAQESTGVPILSTRVGLLLALILPLFAIAPLFYPGYFQTHSGFVPVWNVADLRANPGQLGWLPNIATEFDLVRNTGLWPYYLAGSLPVSAATAVKLVIGVGWLLGSLGMFLWLRSWLGNAGGLVAALVYTYLPYQIVTAYVRGAWGETLFWGLFPWALLVTSQLVRTAKLWLVPVGVVVWLALGLTQLGLTFWALIFTVVLLLVTSRPFGFLAALSAVVGFLLAVATYLYLPAGSSISRPLSEFADHFVFPFQLFAATWGFGPSLPGWNDDLALQLGLAAVGLASLGVFLWQRGGSGQLDRVGRTDRRLFFFSLTALVLILLVVGLPATVWNVPLWPGNRLSDTLTYPWQLLGLVGLCLSVLAGAALWLDRQLARLPLFGSIILIVILSVYPYLSPRFVQIDSSFDRAPQAELGPARLALLEYDVTVLTSGHTVALGLGQTAIPLDIHGPLKPGDSLLLNVTWQPLQPISDDLKVFVHLVDSGDRILAQFDGPPLEGTYSTAQWIPGEVVLDAYPIVIPADAPAGPFRIFVGLYDEATMLRLPVVGDDAGRVIIDVS